MTSPRHGPTRGIVLLARELTGESLRGARAVGRLDAVRVFGIAQRLPDARDAGLFERAVRVEDIHDPAQLIAALRGLAEGHGPIERVVTAQETLLVAASQAAEAIGIRGPDGEAVRRTLDKARLREALESAGVGTARGALIGGIDDARKFVGEVGFPIVLKPRTGSGGLATWRISGDEQLALAVELMTPSPESPVLGEECNDGPELCLDTITIANVPRLYSVGRYRPSILEALEDPTSRWTCVLPRDNGGDRCREFVAQGLEAVRALVVGDAVTHMEGFLTDGGGPRFTDATLRPAGARIGPMLGLAYDIDPHFAWARAVVDGAFDGPWERRYAVGTVFLRGTGRGRVGRVEGVEAVGRELGDLLVENRPPRPGAPRSATYTGDGYMTVRHPETRVVEEALRFIDETVRVTYTDPEPPESRRERWAGRLDPQLSRPAWDRNPQGDERRDH